MFKLTDEPSARRIHEGHVPLAGGAVIVIGLWLSATMLPKSVVIWAILLLSLPVFALGALDNKYGLPAAFRLIAQLAMLILVSAGVKARTYAADRVFDGTPVALGPAISTIFTVLGFCVCSTPRT